MDGPVQFGVRAPAPSQVAVAEDANIHALISTFLPPLATVRAWSVLAASGRASPVNSPCSNSVAESITRRRTPRLSMDCPY
jgi:hypothetical protein